MSVETERPRRSIALSRFSVTRHGRRASVRSEGAWAGISRTGLTTGLTSSAGTKRQAQTYILAARNRNYFVKYVLEIFQNGSVSLCLNSKIKWLSENFRKGQI